jgi:hypothetical protein
MMYFFHLTCAKKPHDLRRLAHSSLRLKQNSLTMRRSDAERPYQQRGNVRRRFFIGMTDFDD